MEQFVTSRDCTVSEHFDTKSVVEVTSSLESHATTIFVKWRPFGRSNSRLAMGWIAPAALLNSRDPVSPGEVEGVVHRPLGPGAGERNARSSRRGKEQMRPKTSESGRAMKFKRRDLRTGDNPYNGTRGTVPSTLTSKCTTLQKEENVSGRAALMIGGR